ncbi:MULTISPECIES: hypothetical protein [unclassified Leeuwenhoekiella]|uniref:hypothetical protein n=1 Tax=unclassified Leeuwenhoekiella TaxID=2615029 RepID=UPI0025C3FA89|nr:MULTISPECIES: hypothetical protein [unclassified Leeuwenhoekiella]
MERHILFAPNYLITTEELPKAKRYIFGGHSILVIEETSGGKGLYFERSRASKSNKFTPEGDNKIHIGFQSIKDQHYIIFGFRQGLAALDAGDQISFSFKNEENLMLNLEAPVENFGESKKYACNLRAQITQEEAELFRSRLVHSYTAQSEKGIEVSSTELDKDFSRKLRELAQTYAFCLRHYYK